MKKVIIFMLAIATTVTASEELIRDAVFGSALGAVIGNNTGNGDAKTGAVIGGVTAIIFGEKAREERCHKPRQYRVREYNPSRHYGHYQRVEEKIVKIEERAWVPERKVYDSCGNLIYYKPGHYVTHYKYRTVPVCN